MFIKYHLCADKSKALLFCMTATSSNAVTPRPRKKEKRVYRSISIAVSLTPSMHIKKILQQKASVMETSPIPIKGNVAN